MAALTDKMQVIREVIGEYASAPVNGYAYLTESDDGKLLSVIDVYQLRGQRYANAGLIVHIAEEHIVVERDMNNKPLVDALLQAGFSRNQIILAYAGEHVPEIA